MSSTTHFVNHVLMSFCLLKTHLAPHVFQSPFLAFLSNKKSVKRLIINSLTLYYVVLRGLEPRLREPKTLVLPLHHRTNMSNHTVMIAGAKVVDFSSTTKLFALFIARKRRLCLFFCGLLKESIHVAECFLQFTRVELIVGHGSHASVEHL